MNCPSCGAAVPSGARFCPACGHSLVVRGDERRVITVVFGDIVGFTSLSEALDPERVKIFVDDVFERLAADIVSFGGQVDKIVGDGIVALFGAPVAHEDDAERAVRAALKMQDTVRLLQRDIDLPLSMRIGVNTGEAVVGALRADGEYTATGDAVNTASRLQSAADPGSVFVGALTHDATASVVRYELLGPIVAKGKEEPIEAWRAIEPVGRPGERRGARTTKLVGRDAELSTLRLAFDVAVQQRRSQLLLILGEAGVGKSRLAEEMSSVAQQEHQALVLPGRCVPYGEANPWWPLAEALREAFAIDTGLPFEEARGRIVTKVAEAYRMSPTEQPVERTVAGILNLFDYYTQLRQLDPETTNYETGRAVRTYLQARANRGPVVLWLADLHWADDVVLRMIDALVTRLARVPFVLMATARYSLNERWAPAPGRHNVLMISLDPLERVAAEKLLAEMLPDSASPALRRDLLDRAGGNPFFLQELVSLVAGGTSSTLSHAELPSSVRGLVSARLDGLPQIERSVVEDAAVMGRRGSVMALTRMSSLLHEIPDVGEVLRSLRDKDLLLLDRDEWSFRSDLVRDIAYSRLTKTDRARRHAGIAEYLVQLDDPSRVDTIAYHYRRAAELALELGGVPGMPDDLRDRAVEWLDKAAAGSSGRADREVAARLYGQALALLAAGDGRRPALLLGRAKALLDDHELPAARRDVAEARVAAGADPGTAALATMRLGEIEQKSGDYDRAVTLFEDAVALFRRLGDTSGMAEALRLAGMTYLFTGRNDEAEASISAALQAFQDANDPSGEAWSHQNLGWIAYVRGRLSQAERRVALALELFERLGDDGGASWCHGLLAHVRLHQGRLEEADALSAKAYANARDRGDRWGEGMTIVIRALVHLWSGRTDAAVRRAEEAAALFRTLGEPIGELQALATLGRALVLAGRIDDGFHVFIDASARRSSAQNGVFMLVSTAAANAAVTVGDPVEATRWAPLADAAVLDPILAGQGDRLVAIGLAQAQLGELDIAIDVLEIAARNNPDGGPSASAQAALALVLAVQGNDRRACELSALAAASHRATYADRVLLEIAQILIALRAGRAVDAHSALTRAWAQVAETDDRAHDMLVSLAAAVVLGTADARLTLEHKLATLGVDAHGWQALFDRALAANAPSVTARPAV